MRTGIWKLGIETAHNTWGVCGYEEEMRAAYAAIREARASGSVKDVEVKGFAWEALAGAILEHTFEAESIVSYCLCEQS